MKLLAAALIAAWLVAVYSVTRPWRVSVDPFWRDALDEPVFV